MMKLSRESSEWLHNNSLIGYVLKRGNAWWHRKGTNSAGEPNHFDGPVPFEKAMALIDVPLVEADVTATYLGSEGVTTVTAADRKAIVRTDTGDILGMFKSGYQIHGYAEWLLSNVKNILDADLAIGSAGLLRKGAQAYVQVEMADTVTVESVGFDFRPFLLASTSCDGSLATSYSMGAQAVVCDNTRDAALSTADAMVKFKHTSKSLSRIQNARDALGIIHKIEEAFAAEVEALAKTVVTDAQWDAFLVELLGTPAADASKNAVTIHERKRDEFALLWNKDERVSPWKNTALGVIQAVNTHAHHVGNVRGMDRAQRNAARMVSGEFGDLDRQAKSLLSKVLSNA